MECPQALILDDGELDRHCVALQQLGVELQRSSGAEVRDGLPGPTDLLITNGRHTLALPELVSTASGRPPTWICIHNQDFHPLRERLRGLGVHYLVQTHASDPTLDLFFAQLVHPGQNRRALERIPVGCEVKLHWKRRTPRKAMLRDLSPRGLRLGAPEELPIHAPVEVVLPAELAGSPITLSAVVERCEPSGSNWEMALLWGILEPNQQALIDALTAGRRAGTRVTPLQSRPYVDGTEIPDWDQLARDADRRATPRHVYFGHVDAFSAEPGHAPIAALGRDLSERGMRIGPVRGLALGTDLTLALHAGNDMEPILVEARVAHRHPDESLGLTFRMLSASTRHSIGRLLAQLPCVAAITGEEDLVPTAVRIEPQG
jgi:hypothetical protein